MHKTWLRKSAAHPNRGLTADGAPVPEGERKSTTQKNSQLDMMLNYIAGYASVISWNTVVIKSTCLNDIRQNLRQYYLFTSSCAQFLDLASIKWLPDEHHVSCANGNTIPTRLMTSRSVASYQKVNATE